jgi:23S rRNA (guanosine2251-2'-O)-methyltransferase
MMNDKSKPDLIFGTRPVIEAIQAGKEIEKLLVQKGLNNALISELMLLCGQNHIPVSKVPPEKLDRVTRKNHQGVIAFISAVEYASLDNVISDAYQNGKDPFLLILDRVTDVRNFGAIARSAECIGADALVIPDKGSAMIGADAVKTSAGALHHLPVCRVKSLLQTLKYLQQNGLRVIAATEKAEKQLYELNLTGPIAVILGSEEDGVSPELLQKADELALIPMQGKIDSLNVSVSAAIFSYEILRQRKTLA